MSSSPGLEVAAEALATALGHFTYVWRRNPDGTLTYDRDPVASQLREQHLAAAAAALRVGAFVAPTPVLPGYVVVPDEHDGPTIWHYDGDDDLYPAPVLAMRDLIRVGQHQPGEHDHTALWDHIASACTLALPNPKDDD